MRVLGIDPGLRTTGWGIVTVDGARLRHVSNGTCKGGVGTMPERLLALYDALSKVIREYRPDLAAVETTFVNKDSAGSLKLGQARGVALLALAEAGLEVGEYAPNAVKKTVVGVGHAEKAQVMHMVRMQLPGVEIAGMDAADALAVAICHAHHAQTAGRIAAGAVT